MTDEITRTTVRLRTELHVRLKKEAADQGRTIEDLIRSAIERELSGPVRERFAVAPRADERQLLRGIEKTFDEYLERIRKTLAVPDIGGHEFIVTLARTFLECLPVPVLIRENSGEPYWRNPAYSEIFAGIPERETLAEIDSGGRDGAGFGMLPLQIGQKRNQSESNILFDSWQFRFLDSNDQRYTGELLLPHTEVNAARQEREVLLPLPQTLHATLSELPTSPDDPIHDLLASFLDRIPISVVVKDVGGRYQWANPFFLQKIAKKELNEIIGKKPKELFKAIGISAVNDQETVVRTRKMGLLAPAAITPGLMRVGLRFPLLDSQDRVTYLGTLGIDRPYPIDHIEEEIESGAQV